jgi:hypothetical protein
MWPPCLTFRVFGRVAAALLTVAAVAACGGGSSPAPAATAGTVADALSRVAATAASLSYSATYTFFEAADRQSATVQVWRSPPSLRVDVVEHGTTATLIVGDDATYSCSMTGTRRACLRVAAAGQPLPAPFNVAPVNLFTVYVRQLAARTVDYDVVAATAPSPTTRCFAVTPKTTAAAPQVPKGTYCFSADGVLSAATYPSGNTITLQSQQAATPAPAQFSPYAKPTPLPS